MKFVRMIAALLVFSSAPYLALAGPTSGMVIVNAGGALAQDLSDTVPAGNIGTIVAGPKTVSGIVYVNVNWNGTAAFQANYNGWVVDSSLSQYTGRDIIEHYTVHYRGNRDRSIQYIDGFSQSVFQEYFDHISESASVRLDCFDSLAKATSPLVCSMIKFASIKSPCQNIKQRNCQFGTLVQTFTVDNPGCASKSALA